MQYKLNTKRPPYNVEAFQWDGTHDKSNWPDWAKNPAKERHVRVSWSKLVLVQPGIIAFANKGNYIVKYPSGNLAVMTEKDFRYNFVVSGT